jgi:Transposase
MCAMLRPGGSRCGSHRSNPYDGEQEVRLTPFGGHPDGSVLVTLGRRGRMALMGAKRKSYTPVCRREAAHLVIDSRRRIVEVAREIGVGEQLLGRWVALERVHMEGVPPAVSTRASRAGAVAA